MNTSFPCNDCLETESVIDYWRIIGLMQKNSIKPAGESLPLGLRGEAIGFTSAKWRENKRISYKV
ncbi:hypothetical protein [Pantoea sp.]|uniref:hypothetical protein n=1 Tax=Pantoea sp. TaxID=69393 RepID=UPI002915B19D|nr:hypothetical protein [Pantoea sp.]MDU5473553.1 hypothetical protein [Pantoea sp.]